MTRDRLLIAALAAVALAALGITGMALWDTADPAPARPTLVAAERPEAPVRGDRRVAERRARPKGKAKVRPKRVPKQPELPAEDRILAREEYREERLVDVNDRLDLYAEAAGWDEDTTEQVRTEILDNADTITVTLQAVAEGEATWDEVREDLRQQRLERANRVRGLLGEREFEAFVREMDFARFLGEEPVRGRITRR